ncbi:MAG: hypothetical protein IKZ92_03540 [Muribaculaceae bacterium]|nr:hypothetical protein [Muribaculaceae bacterium]
MTEQQKIDTRKIAVDTKMGATAIAFAELKGLVDVTKFARQFVGMTGKEFKRRYDACLYRHHGDEFTDEQFAAIAAAFRDIANQLNKAADEIDAAPNE